MIGVKNIYLRLLKIIIAIVLIVQLIILFMGKVLRFAELQPNHPQPTKNAEVCLVQQKGSFMSHCQLQKTNIGAKKT